MDAVFLLPEGDRAPFIFNLIQSIGCTYICLWSYNISPQSSHPPPYNSYLSMRYGYYHEMNLVADPQPSSSTSARGSVARTLFEEYRHQSIFLVPNHDLVPGLAFIRRSPYLELREPELHRLSSSEPQRRLYQEAGIKMAVFMGCNSGEIEIGLSNMDPQISNLEMEMRNLFPEDFSSREHESPAVGVLGTGLISGSGDHQQQQELHLPAAAPNYHQEQSQQHRSTAPDSSSSSIDSPAEYHHSSLLFTIPTPSSSTYYSPYQLGQRFHHHHHEMNQRQQQHLVSANPLLRLPTPVSNFPTSTSIPPDHPAVLGHDHDQAALTHQVLINQSFPTPESTDAAMTRAILAILSSSTSNPPPQNLQSFLPSAHHHQSPQLGHPQRPSSAFKRYSSIIRRSDPNNNRSPTSRRQNVLKRIVVYLRNLNYTRLQQLFPSSLPIRAAVQGSSGSSRTQLHHMIMERKRREKISESFQALRSLLPPGTKKDKASVLRTTKEYLNYLKTQISELTTRNQILEAHLHSSTQHHLPSSSGGESSSGERRLSVNITPAVQTASTSSDNRIVDLRVVLGSADFSSTNFIVRILEFLKQVREVGLISMDAHSLPATSDDDQIYVHRLTMRLRIEGNWWDESAFQEAVRRVLADMTA